MNLFGLGPMELGLILLVVLVLFGPKRLPELGKTIGKTMKSVQDAMDGKDEKKTETAQVESSVTDPAHTPGA